MSITGVRVEAMSFNVRKAAEVVTFFARERGGVIDVLDAVKLAYVSDRRALELYDLPMLNDEFCSMAQGPVGSATYDMIKGKRSPNQTMVWQKYLKGPKELKLTPTRAFADDEFAELSVADLEILYWVAHKYKDVKLFKLADQVHVDCREWKNPGNHRVSALPYREIFKALGKKNPTELEKHVADTKNLVDALQGLK